MREHSDGNAHSYDDCNLAQKVESHRGEDSFDGNLFGITPITTASLRNAAGRLLTYLRFEMKNHN